MCAIRSDRMNISWNGQHDAYMSSCTLGLTTRNVCGVRELPLYACCAAVPSGITADDDVA